MEFGNESGGRMKFPVEQIEFVKHWISVALHNAYGMIQDERKGMDIDERGKFVDAQGRWYMFVLLRAGN